MFESNQRLRISCLAYETIRRTDGLLILALAPATLLNALSTLRSGHAIIHLPCLITLLTGHPCPGCGLTRAITQLWLGHFRQALEMNPLSPLVFSLMLVLFSQKLSRLVIYQRELFPPQPATQP